IGRQGPDAMPIGDGVDRPLHQPGLLRAAPAVGVAHAPVLDEVRLARVELDVVPAVLALELHGRLDEIGRRGLAVVAVSPEGNGGAAHLAPFECGPDSLTRIHARSEVWGDVGPGREGMRAREWKLAGAAPVIAVRADFDPVPKL